MINRNSRNSVVDEKQAAEYLGLSVSLLRKWRVKRDGGPVYIKIGRAVRYSTEDLDGFLQARRVQPESRQEVIQ